MANQALDIDGSVHILWSNRSAAFLAVKDFANAASDARSALELNSSFIKSYYRLASALSGKLITERIIQGASDATLSFLKGSAAWKRPPKLHDGD